MYTFNQSETEKTLFFYIERTELNIVSLLVRYTMCIQLTPVLYFLTTLLIEVYSQCHTESVSLRDIVKSTSRAEISSPSSLYFKAVKGALSGSALMYMTLRKRHSHYNDAAKC